MSDKYTIVRYTSGQRINHWLIALCFILLTASGLALFHPAFYWMAHLLGSPTWTRILHPFIGVFMFLCFFIFAIRMAANNAFTAADREWVAATPKVLKKQPDVPDSGKYNGGQKLIFYVFIILMIGLLLSGLVMWRQYFSHFFSVDIVRLASVIHALFAFLMICAIIVHVYAAIWVKGSVRAMTRGTVSPGWAWKNHRLWYRKVRNPDLK